MNQVNNSIVYTFNVGGTRFSFSQKSIETSGNNVLSAAISREWKKAEEVFIDASPKIFERWIAPYIRDLTLPDLNSIKDGQEKQCIIAAANRLAIVSLIEHIQPPVPENACGPDLWKELGVEVTDVPPVPKVILDLKDPENYLIVLIPPMVSINDFGKIVEEKLKLKWNIWDKIENDYGDNRTEKAYWVAIRTKMDKKSHAIVTRKEQIKYAKENPKGHQAPSLLEAIACNVASYKKTGKSLLGINNMGWVNYTCCREEIIDGKELPAKRRVVVGGSPAGLNVFYFYDSDYVGVAPLLGEF